MKQQFIAVLLAIVLCGRAQADLFDSMLDTIKDTAVITATTLVTAKATELIVNMIIEYSTEQTKTDEQVSKEYEEQNGALPATTTVSSYQTTLLPGASVTPGTEVHVKSVIAVVPVLELPAGLAVGLVVIFRPGNETIQRHTDF